MNYVNNCNQYFNQPNYYNYTNNYLQHPYQQAQYNQNQYHNGHASNGTNNNSDRSTPLTVTWDISVSSSKKRSILSKFRKQASDVDTELDVQENHKINNNNIGYHNYNANSNRYPGYNINTNGYNMYNGNYNSQNTANNPNYNFHYNPYNYQYNQQYPQQLGVNTSVGNTKEAKSKNNGRVLILNKVFGLVKPGQLCAIMGSSGSGKTTLLNAVSFRNYKKLVIEGDIKVNGKVMNERMMTKISAYVQQTDIFIGTLTVKENLTFLAMVRLGPNFTKQQRKDRVNKIIRELNLSKCKNTRIGQGDRIKGISGGEKRRLAFASEVLTNPALLFCDEPTSGLDSFMALSIVESMKKMVNKGKTVISTIHQPSSQMMQKFDILYLLAEGRVAYMGPANEAVDFFSKLGYRVPSHYNPSDYFIEVLAVHHKEREKSLKTIATICAAYDKSDYKRKLESEAKHYQNGEILTSEKYKWCMRIFIQLRWLFWRQSKNSIREPIATYALFFQSVGVGVFLGLVYLNIKLDEFGVQNINGLLFLLLIQCNFGYVITVLNTFHNELETFYREAKSETYMVLPYYLCKITTEFPKYVIFPFILIVITWFMAGLSNNAAVFFSIAATYLLTTQVSVAYGMFLSIASPTLDVALGLAIPLLLPLFILGGFFLNNSSVPVYLLEFKYISWFYYGNEIALSIYWSNINSIPCTNNGTSICYKNGNDVLKFLGAKESNIYRDVGLLLTLLFSLHILAYLVLEIKLRLI